MELEQLFKRHRRTLLERVIRYARERRLDTATLAGRIDNQEI